MSWVKKYRSEEFVKIDCGIKGLGV